MVSEIEWTKINDAKTAEEAAVLLFRGGWTPIKVVGKNPAFGEGKGWQKVRFKSEEEVRKHFAAWTGTKTVKDENGKPVKQHCNVGVLMGRRFLLGHNSKDTLDAAESLCHFHNDTLLRMGSNPYPCPIFEITDDGPLKKTKIMREVFDEQGKKSSETLTDLWTGEAQFVAWGIHPDGKTKYQFLNDEPILPVTTAYLKELVAQITRELDVSNPYEKGKGDPAAKPREEGNIFDLVKGKVRISDILGVTDTRIKCPLHSQGTSNPAAVIYDNREIHCHSAGCHADVIGLYAHLNNLSQYEAAKQLAEKHGIEIPKPKEIHVDWITEPSNEPNADKYWLLKLNARYFVLVRSKGNSQTYIAIFDKTTIGACFARHKEMKKNEDGEMEWTGDYTWSTDATKLMSCGILIEKIARRNVESAPYLMGKLTGVNPEIPFEKTPTELCKFLITEGRVSGSDITLKNAIMSFVAHVREQIPEETALGYTGVRLEGDKLTWRDSRNAIIIPSHPAARTENRKIEERYVRAATQEQFAGYTERLKRFATGLPKAWRANFFIALGHGMMSHVAPILKDSKLAFGDLWAVGPNTTTKTPQIFISNSLFGDGVLHSSAEVDTRFKKQTMESRVGVLFLDEKLDDKSIELTKAQATSTASAARGQTDGTMITTELVAVRQITSNEKPNLENDAGGGVVSRNLVLRYDISETEPDSHFAADSAYLSGDDAPLVGRMLLDSLIVLVNNVGWAFFTEKIRDIGTKLEEHLTFSKRSQTCAAAVFGADFILEMMGYNEEERKNIINAGIHNAKKSDEEDTLIDSLLEYVRSCDDEHLRKLSFGKKEVITSYNGRNPIGGYCKTDNGYIIQQTTIELWKKRRGERTGKKALADIVGELERAGLSITKPQNQRVNGEQVWGALANFDKNTLTNTNEDILTYTNNILTIILEIKNRNVSIINTNVKEKNILPNPKQPKTVVVHAQSKTIPGNPKGGVPSKKILTPPREAQTVSISSAATNITSEQNVRERIPDYIDDAHDGVSINQLLPPERVYVLWKEFNDARKPMDMMDMVAFKEMEKRVRKVGITQRGPLVGFVRKLVDAGKIKLAEGFQLEEVLSC